MGFIIDSYRYAVDAAWAPSDLADLVTWLDADDSATITHSSGSVIQWDDKAGTNDFTQSTGAVQPSTGSTTLNSLNVIGFASGDYLTCTTTSWGDNITIAAVFKGDGTSDGIFNATNQLAFSTANGVRFDINASNSRMGIAISGSGTFAQQTDSSTSAQLKVGTYDGSTISDYINGNTPATASKSGNIDYTGVTETLIGLQFTPNNGSLDGYLAELVICDAAIGTTDRQKLEGYLAHKWGLTANLPSGHPYKSTAP